MSGIDTKKLRDAAESATPGPWTVEDSDAFSPTQITSDTRDICSLETYDHRPDERTHDAAFIAAANPQTVIALLDEIERLRAEIERLGAGRLQSEDPWKGVNDSLKARIAELVADAGMVAAYNRELSRAQVAEYERDEARQQLAAMTAARDEIAAARNALGALARRFTQPSQIGEAASREYADYIEQKMKVGPCLSGSHPRSNDDANHTEDSRHDARATQGSPGILAGVGGERAADDWSAARGNDRSNTVGERRGLRGREQADRRRTDPERGAWALTGQAWVGQ